MIWYKIDILQRLAHKDVVGFTTLWNTIVRRNSGTLLEHISFASDCVLCALFRIWVCSIDCEAFFLMLSVKITNVNYHTYYEKRGIAVWRKRFYVIKVYWLYGRWRQTWSLFSMTSPSAAMKCFQQTLIKTVVVESLHEIPAQNCVGSSHGPIQFFIFIDGAIVCYAVVNCSWSSPQLWLHWVWWCWKPHQRNLLVHGKIWVSPGKMSFVNCCWSRYRQCLDSWPVRPNYKNLCEVIFKCK